MTRELAGCELLCRVRRVANDDFSPPLSPQNRGLRQKPRTTLTGPSSQPLPRPISNTCVFGLVPLSICPSSGPLISGICASERSISSLSGVDSAQIFDWAARAECGDNLSFNSRRCLAEHRPLGGISRARRQVYLALSKLRDEHNRAVHAEPLADAGPW
jgi:hypothetical protein